MWFVSTCQGGRGDQGEGRNNEYVQLVVNSHATDDMERLRLCAVTRFFHVCDRNRDVDVHAAEISLPEHFEVWREEILQQKMFIIGNI